MDGLVVGGAILILLLLAFILLWAVAFYFLRNSRFLRLTICLGFLVALMRPWSESSLALMAVIVALPIFVLEWAATRQPK